MNPITKLSNLSAIVASLLIGFSSPAVWSQQQEVKSVTVDTVELSEQSEQKWSIATVMPVEAAHIATESSGALLFVAEPGSAIKKGELLIALDDRIEQNQVAVAKAVLQQEIAQSEFLNKQRNRLLDLAKEQSISQSELDEIEYQLARSVARINELESQLAIAEVRYEKKRVYAPFDGTVAQKFLWQQEYAEEGADVMAFVNTSLSEVSTRIAFRDLEKINKGMKTLVRDGDNEYECVIHKVIPVSYDTVRMGEFRAQCNGHLFVGSRVELNIPSHNAQPALMVNKDSVLIFPNGNYLFKVNEDNSVTEFKVELGKSVGNRVEIKAELKPGDKVVLQGAETLADGQKIKVL
ncbi:efflux RND transporter periplasmic adaptor subunit [Pseudoalteromonas rubra]|uniref:Multidrug resistance protein MdtA-like C-terminal permuted SH3 domain-containing protein n=1 Tax=Pseudoalteromonas rubra TaxID=43658 RepID=A0A4Q7ELV9_9GAMM|nr:efflux RND transporter periplasmic adaptor subunit [Pseudoalteromonas rubra]RZM84294.1 hypothetical protein C3B51_04070 [Pseudoalteromonas rubra]